ncbi:unnamed protein product, partial [Rotaria magnacalcarata]
MVPELILLERSANRAKRSYRRNKTDTKLQCYLSLKEIFIYQRTKFLYEKREQKVKWIAHGHNLWKLAKPSFHVYSPQFRGIKNGSEIITENAKIVDILADYFEKHFQEPEYDKYNSEHLLTIERFNQIEYTSNLPLEPITMNEVQLEWKKFKPKKSSDNFDTPAFILKQLPAQYLGIITVLFNKCVTKGNVFEDTFDRMWFAALISTLYKLEMSLSYIKWIASWLQNRTLAIHYGDTISRTINMKVGAPQGSILAAPFFRLHLHFLPSVFFQLTTQPFADDLAILITGSLEGDRTYRGTTFSRTIASSQN